MPIYFLASIAKTILGHCIFVNIIISLFMINLVMISINTVEPLFNGTFFPLHMVVWSHSVHVAVGIRALYLSELHVEYNHKAN